MTSWITGYLDRLFHRRSLGRWSRLASGAADMPLEDLKALRARARQMRRELDRLLYQADQRLSAPLIEGDPIYRHPSSDWVWRPDVWRAPIDPLGFAWVSSGDRLGQDVKVFHDARTSGLGLRQMRNARPEDYAPFSLQFETYDFDGSFFSVVLDLPGDAAESMKLKYVLRLDIALESEGPIELIARINIKHGPNTDQIVREIPLESDGAPQGTMMEFDLAYAKINEKRIEKIWLDLIFGNIEMNKVVLRDVSLSRHLRSEL